MGYEHRLYTTNCGNCETEWLLRQKSWRRRTYLPRTFNCTSCGATNTTKNPCLYPDIPRVVYCGHDRNLQLEIFAYPPGYSDSEWAQPYSIRSFVFQASQRLQSCRYQYGGASEIMGEPVHTDYCIDGFWDAGEFIESNREHCHLLGGWIRGKDTCALWDELTKYCQTDNERRFLKAYLNLVKGRNFPMLLPQMRVGIAERRRPDFVVFVPMQYLVYKRYAIELDGGHGPERTEQDEARALDLAAENYE